MRRGIWLVLLLSALLLWPPAAAQAHTLRTDRDISALLHISPVDVMYPGKKAELILYFDDVSGKLDLSNCDCRYRIDSESETVEGTYRPFSKTIAKFNYKPPGEGLYGITISGSPTASAEFQSFRLNYLERVTEYQPVRTSYEDYTYKINPLAVNCYGQCLDISAQRKIILYTKSNLYGL